MADGDDRIIRIENKIDKISDKIGSIDVTLAAQHESLKEHIRRTNLLEKDMTPIKTHVDMVHGVLKFFGFVSVMAVITEGLVALLTYIRK